MAQKKKTLLPRAAPTRPATPTCLLPTRPATPTCLLPRAAPTRPATPTCLLPRAAPTRPASLPQTFVLETKMVSPDCKKSSATWYSLLAGARRSSGRGTSSSRFQTRSCATKARTWRKSSEMAGISLGLGVGDDGRTGGPRGFICASPRSPRLLTTSAGRICLPCLHYLLVRSE
jgi:hypothetical protein